MEALRLRKHLVVVINTALMNNHQTELAHALGKRKHLFVVEEPRHLLESGTWKSFHDFVPVPQEGGDEYDFPRLLDSFLGFASKKT
jgi:beta-1,4-N-acetylglucosaminyltransferase